MKFKINESRFIELVSEMIGHQIDSYYISEKGWYSLIDKDGKCLINYIPGHREIYYDHSLFHLISRFISIEYEPDIFRAGLKKFFNFHFPELVVRTVTGANIV